EAAKGDCRWPPIEPSRTERLPPRRLEARSAAALIMERNRPDAPLAPVGGAEIYFVYSSGWLDSPRGSRSPICFDARPLTVSVNSRTARSRKSARLADAVRVATHRSFIAMPPDSPR